MWYRFGPGDWVWLPKEEIVGTVLTRESVEDPRNEWPGHEIVYEVEDMVTGEVRKYGEDDLEGPLNEMEVLARVRSLP